MTNFRCEVIVLGEYGRPQCCGVPAAHVVETQPMCHEHLMSLQPIRQYAISASEQRFRKVLETIMAAP